MRRRVQRSCGNRKFEVERNPTRLARDIAHHIRSHAEHDVVKSVTDYTSDPAVIQAVLTQLCVD